LNEAYKRRNYHCAAMMQLYLVNIFLLPYL